MTTSLHVKKEKVTCFLSAAGQETTAIHLEYVECFDINFRPAAADIYE